jgi:beta-glucosidase-like glycosyl hydrolase
VDEKIGQLFVIPTASQLTPVIAATSPYRLDQTYTEDLIKKYAVGGLIFLYPGDPVKQAELTNHYQKMSKYPLLIALDAEWGLSMRLKNTVRFPRNMALGAIQNNTLLHNMALEIAKQLKTIGVHMNLAPVLDINSNPANPVIHDRSFGDDKELVTQKSVIFMQGLLDGGILPCIKHFPGHGDTAHDSHLTTPVIQHSKEMLTKRELYPFAELINQGAPAVMTAHLAVPALDESNTPATLSPNIIQLLRTQLGFNGLIITDGLGMKGVQKNTEPGHVECAALLAGNDILLCPVNVPEAINLIKKTVADGTLSEAELDAHVLKILIAKSWAGLDENRFVDTHNLVEKINTPEAYALKKQLYAHTITPLCFTQSDIVYPTEPIAYIQVGHQEPTVYGAMLKKNGLVHELDMPKTATAADLNIMVKRMKAYTTVNIGIFGITKAAQYNGLGTLNEGSHNISPIVLELVRVLRAHNKKIIITLFGSAYSARLFSEQSLILAYEDDCDAQEAAADVLYGKLPALGKLPVTLLC